MQYKDRSSAIWTKTPLQAFTDQAGLCRDFAVIKAILLIESGYPARDLRIVTLMPTATRRNYHVIVLARAAGREFILDMFDKSGPGRAIPADDAAEPITSRQPAAVVASTAWAIPTQTAEIATPQAR